MTGELKPGYFSLCIVCVAVCEVFIDLLIVLWFRECFQVTASNCCCQAEECMKPCACPIELG